MRYIFDTDTVTWHQRRDEQVMRRIEQVDLDEIAVTVVTMYEQLRGRLATINRKQSLEKVEQAFQRLVMTQTYYCYVPVLPFDANATQMYEQLVAQKIRIGTQDLRIAAITLTQNATLTTSNLGDFSQVPNLKIEDWRQ